jgi:acetyl-CoA acetyltransferase
MNTSKLGGAAIGEALREAALYIEAGLVETVLIAGADAYRSRMSRDESQQAFMAMHDRELEGPYGHTAPTHWAINTQKYMEKHGVGPEELAHVAVSAREWAIRNPRCKADAPLTVDEVLASPVISSPLRLYDCSRSLDGGGALVVSAARRAAAGGRPPVHVLGVGAAYSQYYMPDYPLIPDTIAEIHKASCDMAYDAAGVTPKDIDVAFPYDGFSVMVWLFLDAMGFAPPGHAARLIPEGWIAPGGELPVNTHGGALNHGLPAFPAKFFFFTEAVRQLRGEATGRQVEDAELAIFHGVSGVGGVNSTVILGR